jgi:hypothetical protein
MSESYSGVHELGIVLKLVVIQKLHVFHLRCECSLSFFNTNLAFIEVRDRSWLVGWFSSLPKSPQYLLCRSFKDFSEILVVIVAHNCH